MAAEQSAEAVSVPLDQATIVQVLAYRKVVGSFIREAFALAVETGSELLVLSSFKGAVSTWATPKLDPLVNDEGGRKVIAALLKEQLKNPAMVPPSEDSEKEQAEDAKWSESLNFIEDPPKRLQAFQERITAVLKITRDLPEAFPGAEACALVATLGGKIFSFASPALKPLIESKQGRGLIMAMLGDPDAQKLLEENMQDLQQRQKEHFANVTAAAAAAQSEAESASQVPT